jgi:hypothetical protein
MEGMSKVTGVLIGAVVLLIVMGYLIVNLWPVTYNISSNITAMAGTDAGTSIFKALWPVLLIIVAIVVIVSLVFWAIRKMNSNG